ncbi:hypothetical protein [Microbacterium mangrovi]|uniref:hypothetical protein n=1 Tax=Microbacterium mangrovi TaxID=1348253 RepID=UPI000AEF9F1F|nr:hypothetical protein [Microbacterium mangrovi]
MSSLTATAAFADDIVVTAPADLSISGDLKVGSTVSVAGSAWTPDTTDVHVVWSAGGTVVDEPAGQEGDLDLTLLPGMVGKVISADVTGTADGVTSDPVSLTTDPAVVQPRDFALSPTPTISGAPAVGVQVSAVPGEWSPQAPDFSYQWSIDGAAIADATTATYTPVPADQGHALTVAVTASDAADGYADTTRESVPVTVGAGTFANTKAPAITGAARVGSKLTAQTGTWAPSPTAYAYAWKVAGAATPVSTAATFTPTAAQLGKVLTLTVTASGLGYADLAKTSAPVTVLAGVFAAPAPKISGSAVIGRTLTVNAGTWTPVATKTYRWLRNGVTIAGATGTTYRVAAVDYGKKISVVVTGKTAGYTTLSKPSAPTAPVVKPFARTTAPTITGTVRVLSTLTAHRTAWSPLVSSYTWQWKRNGVAISGATGATYKLVAADYGKKITVTLTGKRAGYANTTRTSAATLAVGAPAPVITRSGTYRVGTQIKPGTYAATSGANCYWERDNASGYVGSGPANDRGRTIVTIAPTDKTFDTEGCGSWAPFVVLTTHPATSAGDGMYAIGSQLSAGTYTTTSSATCMWSRLKDATGSDESELGYGPMNEAGRTFVTISPTDKFFATSGCGTWTRFVQPTSPPASSAGAGMYAIGTQLSAGTYTATSSATCMWSRLKDASGSEGSELGFGPVNQKGPTIVTIAPTDRFFGSSGCGTWTLMPATGTPATSAGDGAYATGVTLQAGHYETSTAPSVMCMAVILSGFDGTWDEMLQGGITPDPVTRKLQLNLLPTDKGFMTSGCGTWTRVGP